VTEAPRQPLRQAHAVNVAPSSETRATFRPDIQGLRAVAVLLVVAYHLRVDGLPGGFVGVDVFFVISGFLITSQLVHHPPAGSRDLLEFWGRRIRRILPAAFLVLAVTAIASRAFAPETRWAANAGEIIASALYVQNWVLAANATDYLAAADAATPVQHYWSLAVEEQFYLGWPILILAAYAIARRVRLAPTRFVGLAMLSVVALSLAASIVATADEPASAYFILPTRVWELALGGCIAALPAFGAGQIGRTRDGVAWLGLGMILLAGATITAATPFPGTAAVLPVAGAALVIIAAADGRGSPTRWLRLRPIQHVGNTSYSIYLWHWPLIALWPLVVGPITPIGALGIVALTIGLATASTFWVEDRFRFAPSLQRIGPTFRFAVAGMLLVSILGSAHLVEARLRLDAAVAHATEVDDDLALEWADGDVTVVDEAAGDGSISSPPASTDDVTFADPASIPETTPGGSASPEPRPTRPPSCRGASAIVHGFSVCPRDPAGRMVPDPVVARSDWSDAYRDGCWIYTPFSARTTCRYGQGKVRIALVGNSHAGQWLPTLQVLAKRHGWTITTFLASRCNATDATLELWGGTQGCLDYGRWALDETRGRQFDLVVTSERQSVDAEEGATTRQAAYAGYRSYLKRWSAGGTRILILRDTPFPGRTLGAVPDCLASHRDHQGACDGRPDEWRSIDPLVDASEDLGLSGVTTIDTTRFFCTATRCPAVIGTAVVYFDGSHMTATYARTIAPFLDADILAALHAKRSP
jgi:peptidoglycan/LPS O-acetylase OafA/YrhL